MASLFSLDKSSLHLWALSIAPEESIATALQPLLSDDETIRARSFQLTHLRLSFTICRGVVRLLLGNYLNIEPSLVQFQYQPKGKPHIAHFKHLHFNVSHSAELMLFGAMADGEVGVDVERIRTLANLDDLARRLFCMEEVDELMSLPRCQRQEAFYRCWTRKEAYLKATGEGLSVPLNDFRVNLMSTEAARLIHVHGDMDKAGIWRLSDVGVGNPYVAAVAYPGSTRTIRLIQNMDPRDLLLA